jgi:hypothetical protein
MYDRNTHDRFGSAVFFYSTGMLYHILLLLPMGLYTETDYDNMVCPTGPAVALGLGSWWREAEAVMVAVWALLIGYGVESVALVWRERVVKPMLGGLKSMFDRRANGQQATSKKSKKSKKKARKVD